MIKSCDLSGTATLPTASPTMQPSNRYVLYDVCVGHEMTDIFVCVECANTNLIASFFAWIFQEQARRDVELMQLKKQFLSTYFKEQHAAEQESKKRPTSCALFAVENLAPRPKYRRVSIDTWKDACKKAFHVYDEALPSLEEATQLFGYSTN